MKNWQPPPCSQLPEQDPPTTTVTLPYVRHLSETIRRILAPLRIRTFLRPHRTLRQTLVRLKDHIPLQQRAGVVYRIPCGSCSKVYIGQMGRTMEHRLKKHKRALTSGNTAQSGVAEYGVDQMLEINWKSRSGWFPSKLPPEVCMYWKPGTSVQWTMMRAPYHQSTTPWFTKTSCCLTTLILLHASDILCMCWHYYYYYSIIFFTSPHLTFVTNFPYSCV